MLGEHDRVNDSDPEIPHTLGYLSNLQSLHLGDNSLSGEFPTILKNCQSLVLIDIGGNKLTGNIPPWLGGENYTSLTYLSLRQNRFYGSIPPDICKLTNLQMLDLSGNTISGKIPPCFNNLTSLVNNNSATRAPQYLVFGFYDMYHEYASVQWKHQESEYKKTLGLLKLIDLSSNKLVGNIPKAFSSLRGLISLNLSRNSLTGNIDPSIGEMKMLESLDLSKNQLSGEIPIGLTQLHYLAVLDLSNNNLSGKIPSGTQLQSFDASVYAGNSDLCGPPLMSCLNTSITDEGDNIEEEDSGFMRLSFMQEVGISMVFGFIVGFWGLVGSLVLKKSWRSAYFNLLSIVGDWFYVTLAIFLNKFKRR